MKPIYSKKLLLIPQFIASILLTACFGGNGNIPDDHYYRLPELKTSKLPSPLLNGSLRVKKVITHGIYAERTLIYTDKNNELKLTRYHYHHWEKSPAKIIQDNIVQYLKARGVAHKISMHTRESKPDYILEAELVTLHRHVNAGSYSAAIAIDFRLFNNSNNSIFINKRYYSNITASSEHLVDTIKAYSQGFQQIYDEFIIDLQNDDL